MQIYRALKFNFCSQKFGENKIPYYKDNGMLGHGGMDWACERGDPIYWDGDTEGVVIEVSLDVDSGLGVVIATEGYKHIFWHFESVEVQVGELLETGVLLGTGNNTGISTGDHLHRGLKECDENHRTLNRDNGYRGAIDQEPFMKNIFVLDYMETLKTTVKILEAKKVNLLWAIVLALKKIVLSLKNKLI